MSGEFDLATCPGLATAVAVFQHAGVGDITLLLDDVMFIDAAGIGAIDRARIGQEGRGVRLDVVGASEKIRKVFIMAGFAELLHLASAQGLPVAAA